MATNIQPFIIKKARRAAHPHHGGAWKIAYADFVTAMMAFFLLLWLISMTTPEQKKGLADYFAPPNVSDSTSGAGGVMGGTAFAEDGAKIAAESKKDALTAPESSEAGPQADARGGRDEEGGGGQEAVRASPVSLESKYNLDFHSAAASIRQAWEAQPDITAIEDSLRIEETPEGLNIQLLDQEGRPMFPEGSKYPYEVTRKAIAAVAPALQKLSAQVTVSGHTAAGAVYTNPRYGAWELSMDRANTVRAILGEFGLSDDRIRSVIGQASARPLFPNDPYLAGNGRIEITVLYQAPPVPAGLKP
ncbi:MAG: OmpA family protein [Devosia sp.]|uniref:flagellar motor protein MotB n=1 Tax=Devosia sp. TaxID=1871048 RepID=UPI00260D37DE|nr:flagellar motor protein MotB [Devosia sp.]MDB5538563.1 OmpA family protein [Devosia sp.]